VKTGKTVRLAPRLDVRLRALEYAPEVKQKYRAQLKGYQIMPVGELFSVVEVRLDPDITTVLSRPGVRVRCSSCGEEIVNERQVLADGEPICRTCAGVSYYK
jgi:formylmethanofuran dehydrogenase subunit E